VEKGRSDRDGRLLVRHALSRREIALNLPHAPDEACHHMGGTDGMGESRVVCSRIRERRQSELTNAPQALHFLRLHQARHDGKFIGLEGHQAVYGISQNHRAYALADLVRCLKGQPPRLWRSDLEHVGEAFCNVARVCHERQPQEKRGRMAGSDDVQVHVRCHRP
jgi:hypothetical protein